MDKMYDILEIGRLVRTISDVNHSNSRVVDGPFKSYQAAAEQADRMNTNALAPRYIAVERKS